MAKQIKRTQVAGVLQQLVQRQKNKCAVCGETFKAYDGPALDHNHDTGFIRAAIHVSCNGAEGRIKRQAYRGHKGVSTDKYLIGLGKYLEHHTTPKVNLIHPEHKSADTKRLERNKKARQARAKNKALK